MIFFIRNRKHKIGSPDAFIVEIPI